MKNVVTLFSFPLIPGGNHALSVPYAENITLEALNLESPAIQLVFLEGTETVPVKLVPAIQGAFKLSNQWLREDLAHLSDWWDGDLANEKKSFLRKAAVVQEVGPELIAKGGFWR